MTSGWPYPRWIGHRGAGRLAPENTLAAFALGYRHGYRMFECDVRLSADGQAYLLHDDSLDRTTDAHGLAAAWRWDELARCDAGAWHSPAYAREPLPSLTAVVEFCRTHAVMLNLELKPGRGDEQRTGARVAAQLAQSWCWAPPPLLSSFSDVALAAAAAEAPHLPRGLLFERFPPGWEMAARQLGCVAVIAECGAWQADEVARARAAGLRMLSYTVNDDGEAARLLALGLDGLITDRIDHFAPHEGTPPPAAAELG